MLIVQVAKIQVRRGPESDLPGAPITTSPLVFETPLDPAELAFSTDTGRLFIGHEPEVGQLNYNRIQFPFQNVEVLTETSDVANARVFDAQYRSAETGFFVTIPMEPNASSDPNDWSTVLLPPPAGSLTNVPVRIDITQGVIAATVTYFVLDGSTPLRHGRLMISHDGGVSAPLISDEAIVARRTDLVGLASRDPAALHDTIRFRATVISGRVTLQCRNLTSLSPRIHFRIDRARP